MKFRDARNFIKEHQKHTITVRFALEEQNNLQLLTLFTTSPPKVGFWMVILQQQQQQLMGIGIEIMI